MEQMFSVLTIALLSLFILWFVYTRIFASQKIPENTPHFVLKRVSAKNLKHVSGKEYTDENTEDRIRRRLKTKY